VTATPAAGGGDQVRRLDGALSGPDGPSVAGIDTCVHCGFCLPTCPTYLLWGEEMDSPRGRIYLMKAGVEGRTDLTPSFVGHFDNCLGCLACVTACPSGVQYGPLIEKTRATIEQRYARPAADSWFRALLMMLVPYPARMRWALAPLALLGGPLRALARSLPHGPGNGLLRRLVAMVELAPPVTWAGLFHQVPSETPASGAERRRVALLTGCVQRLSFGGVNEATARVLAAEGCRVQAPGDQGCCGALALHAGHIDRARELARHNIEVFERVGADRVVVNAAGCGSAMKEYGDLFEHDPAWAARAKALAATVRDVSEVLDELGTPRAPRGRIDARVVYHDACHLAHGQGVRSQPRAMLQAKARHLAAASPDMIATANPGCTLQIAAAGRRLGHEWPVVHPIELVDASIRGVDPRGRTR
jgi:glycolate oxidase iron-sulfur subunit